MISAFGLDCTKIIKSGLGNATSFFVCLLVITFLFSFHTTALAQEQKMLNPIQQMAQLNAAGRPLDAYQIGLQLLPQLEGEPAFDLHYGIAAIDSGYASQGAFALERVLMSEPTNDYARLELGRAYFILEEDDRAKAEFQAVLDANPPQEVIDNVRPYLNAIDSRAAWRETTFTASAEIGGGYDSNILAAPDNNELAPGVTLGNQAESDSFMQIKADATISHPLRYGTNLFLSGNVTKRNNDSDQLNIQSYGFQSGVIYRQGAHNIRLALQADILELESDKYRDSIGLNASWQYSLSPQSTVTAFAQIAKQNYNKNYVAGDGQANDLDFRDSLFSIGNLSYRYQFIAPLRPVATFSLTLGKDDADDDSAGGALENVERDIIGASMSLALSVGRDLQLTGSASYESSQYVAPDNVLPFVLGTTPVVRDDKQYRGSLGLAWTPTDKILIKLDGAISPKRSNISILEYDREQLTLSVRYMYR